MASGTFMVGKLVITGEVVWWMVGKRPASCQMIRFATPAEAAIMTKARFHRATDGELAELKKMLDSELV